MKLAIYSKKNLQNHPVKINLTDELKNMGYDVVEPESLSEDLNCDRLLVFGGDGTMLHAATMANCPIVGVNLGNVGFLTQFEADANAEDLDTAFRDTKIFERNLLETNTSIGSLKALNDITVKGKSPRPITLSVFVDDNFVDKYHADGIIVSTPTGSTAYSLSAGGPVLAPDMDAIVINPICPHSLHSRTLIVKADSAVTINVDGDDSVIIADGNTEIPVENNTVSIKKSEQIAQFIGNDNSNFYKKLLEKMNRWGTTC